MPVLQTLATLKGHGDRVWACDWHPSGDLLATCGGDKSIRLWAERGGVWTQIECETDAASRTVRSVAWSPDGRLLASASFDGTTTIWERTSGGLEAVSTLEGHENEVKSVAWDVEGRLLATCSRDKSVWVWEVDGDENDYECSAVVTGHSQDVKQVCWHPTRALLASASYDETVRVWKEDESLGDWVCTDTLVHESTVWSVAFSPSGSELVTVDDAGVAKFWREDLRDTWMQTSTLSGQHTATIYSVHWSKEDVVVTGAGDDHVRFFTRDAAASTADAPVWKKTHDEIGHASDVNCVRWNPKRAGVLASCSDDGTVKLWQFNDPDQA